MSILPGNGLQHVRLLELPAELLTLVTSASPPLLQLKSKEDVTGDARDASAVLCTIDKTWNIRQVSTSNSVYLTQHVEIPDTDGALPRAGVQAWSKCGSMLELLPEAKQSAAPYIKKMLPIYASTGNYGSQASISKAELFSHIPLSKAECQDGWSELACFESKDPDGCFIPSAAVRAQIWQAAITAATAEGADLKGPFIADDIPASALDLRSEWPLTVLAAIFAAVSTPTPGGNLAMDEDRCVRFVGMSQLEVRSAGRATDVAGFKKAWKDAMPEAWRSKCELNVLDGAYSLNDDGSSIKYVDSHHSLAAITTGAPAEAKSAIGAKRKWHDRFRPHKKTA
ncbi:hypothetical protein DOTSEDRAFT_74493 [Dothistroma septosporum NZE10]|uniref:Sister chromatid cohesion protein Dcc1 n=1 Tax=Dothistroma septosporum (strain NZE10 / CBS 128990) TaxID=675120 RepID=N1PHC0_DOTSN|nr:hypothetical protein DOTSEDRAFT_74493 [Dothistroma septosporum NZE10]